MAFFSVIITLISIFILFYVIYSISLLSVIGRSVSGELWEGINKGKKHIKQPKMSKK